jgi:hypothetical protein
VDAAALARRRSGDLHRRRPRAGKPERYDHHANAQPDSYQDEQRAFHSVCSYRLVTMLMMSIISVIQKSKPAS